jgi:hypothetical protein
MTRLCPLPDTVKPLLPISSINSVSYEGQALAGVIGRSSLKALGAGQGPLG